jgi:hypothetical protein
MKPSESNVPKDTNPSGEMKTKLSNLAVSLCILASLSSAASAVPVSFMRFGSAANVFPLPQPVLNARCKANACCGEKTMADVKVGGIMHTTTSKRVVTCKGRCPIEVKQQGSVCRKGMQA